MAVKWRPLLTFVWKLEGISLFEINFLDIVAVPTARPQDLQLPAGSGMDMPTTLRSTLHMSHTMSRRRCKAFTHTLFSEGQLLRLGVLGSRDEQSGTAISSTIL